jgi:uncharacterized repeat protein (TIGR03803 family)
MAYTSILTKTLSIADADLVNRGYKLSPHGRVTVLQSFDITTGQYPIGEVLRTSDGSLYGTSYVGGDFGYGTLWKYVP